MIGLLAGAAVSQLAGPRPVFAALSEPNRLRIVRLLGAAPRPVGEIALALELRQPQVTKHLQTLERAGLVTMHPLGRRRIYSLERESFRRLAEWASTFRGVHPSEAVLDQYQAAIEVEQADARTDPQWASSRRTLRLQRTVAARPTTVWRYWTDADLIRRWWSPEHFTAVECEAKAVTATAPCVVQRSFKERRRPQCLEDTDQTNPPCA